MKILFIGDIVGKPGRDTVKAVLPEVIEKEKPDLVIANAENIHHGSGISSKKIKEMQEIGIEFFTSGNHIWKISEIFPYLDQLDYPLLRPANYPERTPGVGDKIFTTQNGQKVLIINLMGRVYMHADLTDPFELCDDILARYQEKGFELGKTLAAIFVDFHAETGSEKTALAHYLDGRITALIGTHTHIPTADERILSSGTAYQTDAGMNGCHDSVIGVKKEIIIEKFLTQMPVKHELAEGKSVFNAVLIETNQSGLADNIFRIQKYIN